MSKCHWQHSGTATKHNACKRRSHGPPRALGQGTLPVTITLQIASGSNRVQTRSLWGAPPSPTVSLPHERPELCKQEEPGSLTADMELSKGTNEHPVQRAEVANGCTHVCCMGQLVRVRGKPPWQGVFLHIRCVARPKLKPSSTLCPAGYYVPLKHHEMHDFPGKPQILSPGGAYLAFPSVTPQPVLLALRTLSLPHCVRHTCPCNTDTPLLMVSTGSSHVPQLPTDLDEELPFSCSSRGSTRLQVYPGTAPKTQELLWAQAFSIFIPDSGAFRVVQPAASESLTQQHVAVV